MEYRSYMTSVIFIPYIFGDRFNLIKITDENFLLEACECTFVKASNMKEILSYFIIAAINTRSFQRIRRICKAEQAPLI